MQPEVFSLAKDEYEKKKAEGVSDEELFNHMKNFIETKLAEAPPAEPAKEDGEATAPAPDHPAGETGGATEEAN